MKRHRTPARKRTEKKQESQNVPDIAHIFLSPSLFFLAFLQRRAINEEEGGRPYHRNWLAIGGEPGTEDNIPPTRRGS